MILVDTSIWIDHLRAGNAVLSDLLKNKGVLIHPFVAGELALGSLRQHDLVLEASQDLPQASVATDDEVLHLIGRNALSGSGIGYVDAHLLAAARLTPGVSMWTRDKRLHAVADRLGLSPRLH